MATSGLSSPTSATLAPQQIRPKNPAEPAEQLQPARAAEEAAKANQAQPQPVSKAQESQPFINDQGQATGRIVNLTA
jgi:hypothetical protein